MAYNILKGNIQGSVDQYADQEIDGVKVFKNTISASVFYDTDAQSPCATLKDVPIKKVEGGAKNTIMVAQGNQAVKTYHDLRYEKNTLHAKNITTGIIKGSAEKLVKIPTDKFIGPISAEFMCFGSGIENVRGSLQVQVSDGLKCTEEGVGINIAPTSCLTIASNKLTLNPSKSQKINTEGQNLSDSDLLIVHDVSRGTVTNTTLSNLFSSYIDLKIPHAAGNNNTLQFKGKHGFHASDNLSFDSSNNTLNVDGRTISDTIVSKEKIVHEGSVFHNITKVDSNYSVVNSDYTIICDSSKDIVEINLPPAKNNVGRILIIKKANSDKYKLNSNIVRVVCKEGTIDIKNSIDIKMNYSCRTLQSDGNNWWVIGSKGT